MNVVAAFQILCLIFSGAGILPSDARVILGSGSQLSLRVSSVITDPRREQVIFWGGFCYKTGMGYGLQVPQAFSSYMEVSEHRHR